jgi:hypothetical protein
LHAAYPNALAFHASVVTVLQVGLTVIFVLVVAVYHSNQEALHERQSEIDLLFLIGCVHYGEGTTGGRTRSRERF